MLLSFPYSFLAEKHLVVSVLCIQDFNTLLKKS